jgi:hypothetical protein
MAGEIVHDHDISRAQIGDQHLLHIGLERGAVDGATWIKSDSTDW